MDNSHYPTIDISFIEDLIRSSGKVLDIIEIGSTKAFIVKGAKSIGKRTFSIRTGDDNNQVDYMYATAIAIKLDCMGGLLDWLVENRAWKDGAYIVTDGDED